MPKRKFKVVVPVGGLKKGATLTFDSSDLGDPRRLWWQSGHIVPVKPKKKTKGDS